MDAEPRGVGAEKALREAVLGGKDSWTQDRDPPKFMSRARAKPGLLRPRPTPTAHGQVQGDGSGALPLRPLWCLEAKQVSPRRAQPPNHMPALSAPGPAPAPQGRGTCQVGSQPASQGRTD